ncbi:hypothetical protein HFO21_07690 [Rhizobium laguerreae]|uniref:hypothetical protein n=1 Tax=Rhizobium laguerreae TaxID=1076926 RepID=UPI001C8FE684|nr:hypothetical protein [Rhizobium laguerreae]MBY3214262.1 hypothetical protein [Rhizobium laguerreae]MBY3238278.1 hypothetical protein [Rhizobium laguerreae]
MLRVRLFDEVCLITNATSDQNAPADAIRATRRLMAQSALRPYRPEEVLPGIAVGDDEASLAKADGDDRDDRDERCCDGP